MRLPILLIFITYIIASSIALVNSEASDNFYPNYNTEMKTADYLKEQQNSQTGLFRSYDMPGDYTAWTYDQAITIITLNSLDETDASQNCADGMLKIRNKKLKAWADGYHAGSRAITAKPIAVGPNAWMGIALLRLHLFTNKTKYLAAAEKLSEFMLDLQVTDGKSAGSIPGGYDENGQLFNWTSTEHNADFIAFMAGLYKVTKNVRYNKAAIEAARWLNREMWNPAESCYYPGYSNNRTLEISQFHERLDSQTWTILALKAAGCEASEKIITEDRVHNGLPWIDKHRCTFSYMATKLVGYSKITFGDQARQSFWSEGTAGYILASRRIGHQANDLNSMLKSLRYLKSRNGAIPYSVGVTFPGITQQFQSGDMLIAHFEGHPNCLFGNVAVYGDAEPNWERIKKENFTEPYSCYYEPECPDYSVKNVHTGVQSFRLVNASNMCLTNDRGWASLGIDLGPMNENKEIIPFDASKYKQFSFWAKTPSINGARVKLLFREANAKNYAVQAAIVPTPSKINLEWKQYTAELGSISQKVDLEKLVHIGISFGKDIGNPAETILFIDDVALTDSHGLPSEQPQLSMPAVFPQHWPYNNIGAAAWLVFVELDINPFEVGDINENKTQFLTEDIEQASSDIKNEHDSFSYPGAPLETSRIGIGDWLSISANLDLSYRKTQFYQPGHETTMFQWDTRADFWLPPGRDDFSWGPYVRLSGVESNRPYEFENNWGARPGYGFQVYPFSSQEMRQSENPIMQWLWPLHAFVEYSDVYYKEDEHSWRPDHQLRAGLDYWKEINVHDLSQPYWAEIWNGLIWNSTNGFDENYNTLIFANSFRFGLRKPDAGIVSTFSPYAILESSLSENSEYAWENRLLGGGGIRFCLPRHCLSPDWQWLDRFVIYTEYLVPLAYYRSSAPGSAPDHDFRIGVNLVIGEWWYK